MYFNDIHIMWYLLAIVLGSLTGQVVDYCSKMFLQEKKIISKQNIKDYLNTVLPNYILIFTVASM